MCISAPLGIYTRSWETHSDQAVARVADLNICAARTFISAPMSALGSGKASEKMLGDMCAVHCSGTGFGVMVDQEELLSCQCIL